MVVLVGEELVVQVEPPAVAETPQAPLQRKGLMEVMGLRMARQVVAVEPLRQEQTGHQGLWYLEQEGPEQLTL
jgi:hypothetical protein|tara:strand:+ start:219 stop:437 length:219 start_codon:yes stop_codon:yes gene_type:complete